MYAHTHTHTHVHTQTTPFTEEVPAMAVSYKPQKISPKFQGTVRQLLHNKIRESYIHPQFVTDVLKPLQVDSIMDQEVLNLSGGELQRVAITLCLGQVSSLSSSSFSLIWKSM